MRNPSSQVIGPLERVHPFVFPDHGEAVKHMARYAWANKWLRQGDEVYDLACGYGYGTFIMSHKALKVSGVDLNRDAIAYAKKMYRRCKFYAQDVNTFLDRSEGNNKVIVSMETIEHLRKWEDFFRKCVEASEIFIFSVPLWQERTPAAAAGGHQAFGFGPDSFRDLIGGKRNCKLFYQHEYSVIEYWNNVPEDQKTNKGTFILGVVQTGDDPAELLEAQDDRNTSKPK